MGGQCFHVIHLRSPGPISLRPSQGDICDRCREAGYSPEDLLVDAPATVEAEDSLAIGGEDGEDEWLTECGKEVAHFQGPILWCQECMDLFRQGAFPRICEPWDSDGTPPEQRYDKLLQAARVLLDAGIRDEGKIMPTLAFAARVWEVPYLGHIRDQLVEASEEGEESEHWIELRNKFINSFFPLEPLEVVNGVLMIRESPTHVCGAINEAGVIEEISIDVYRRSAHPKQDVAAFYEKYLQSQDIPCDTDRGDVSYKVYANYIRLMARPENRTIDLVGKHTVYPEVEKEQRPFPPAHIIEGMYAAVKGSMSKKSPGFAYVLGGNERGPDAEPDNLIPACVAWYVGNRGRLIDKGESKLKDKVAQVLNEHLLTPCGKDPIPETGGVSHQRWRDTKKWSQAILRSDHMLRDSFGSLA